MAYPRDVPPAAAQLHREALVFDAHADTLTEMTDRGYDLDRSAEGGHLDLARVADGVLDAQILTCFVHPNYLPDRAAGRVRELLDTMDRQRERFPGRVALCRKPGDIVAARGAGRLAVVLAIEGGHAIQNCLGTLQEFHQRGARSMTLTWNNSHDWADGCGDEGRHGGLTDFGREVVTAMEELGMVVDLSHAARSTLDDVLDVARRPLMASHSCARALRDHPRNLDNEALRGIAATGGVACVNFYPAFLSASDKATLDQLLDHVEHFLAVAGADHVGLGTDFDGIPTTPVGLEDVACLPRLTAGLLERGHAPEAVSKVLGGNLLRLFDGNGAGRRTPSACAGADPQRS